MFELDDFDPSEPILAVFAWIAREGGSVQAGPLPGWATVRFPNGHSIEVSDAEYRDGRGCYADQLFHHARRMLRQP